MPALVERIAAAAPNVRLDIVPWLAPSMVTAETAREAGVAIVAGDTKVVPRGSADQLFITTTGLGVVPDGSVPAPHRAAPGDVVLALSHSGETEEVKRILPMIRSLGAGVIAMTGRRSSYLGRTADITIVTPVAREACPYNVAPTASTTVMLATGDALAVAAARLRGFRREDFARLHPAGRLGKLLTLRVRDVMRTGAANPVVRSGASVLDALRIMSRTRLGATSVVGPQRVLVGYFTDGDLRRCIQKDPRILARRIDQVMTRSPRTVGPDELLSAAQATMKRYHCDNVPVTDARGRIIGILDERDILQEGL